MSSPGCVSKNDLPLLRLNSSRARRFARFRTTAEPNFRVAAMPNRGEKPLLGTTKTVMNRE